LHKLLNGQVDLSNQLSEQPRSNPSGTVHGHGDRPTIAVTYQYRVLAMTLEQKTGFQRNADKAVSRDIARKLGAQTAIFSDVMDESVSRGIDHPRACRARV
jgi:hypothetical protein